MTAAVLDACVLYPAALRDLWMHLAVRSVFQPKWTPRIQEEGIRNVLADRPDLKPEPLARTRALMERWGRVVGQFELSREIISSMPQMWSASPAAIAGEVG